MERRTGGSVIARVTLDGRLHDLTANPGNSVAYAALSDSVAFIGSHHEVLCVIPAGGHPRALTIGADGSRLYTVNHGGSVSVIDISDHRVGVIPGACCVQQVDTPDGALIYAAGNATNRGRVWVLGEGTAAGAAVAGFDGRSVTGFAADSQRRRLYVGLCRRSDYHHQYDAGSLAVIDTATGVVIRTVGLIGAPDTITVGGSMVYATHYDHSCVSAIDLSSFDVTLIRLGDSPIEAQITPDGLQAYVIGSGSLSVIDTVAGEAERIPVGDLPRCVRISPSGKYAYVSHFGAGSVSIVDTIAQCVTDTIDVDGHPEALAVSADGDRLYVGDYWSGTVTVLSVQP
ncbi:YncE family protein [Mycobacterium seoulense]|uniref:YncE family protein n=1 Tax=Mycobacterium seoulense TaxID=386911 RepID=UPI003CF2FE64